LHPYSEAAHEEQGCRGSDPASRTAAHVLAGDSIALRLLHHGAEQIVFVAHDGIREHAIQHVEPSLARDGAVGEVTQLLQRQTLGVCAHLACVKQFGIGRPQGGIVRIVHRHAPGSS